MRFIAVAASSMTGRSCSRWACGAAVWVGGWDFTPAGGCFLNIAVSTRGVGVLGSDDVEARFVEDSERGDVVAGRPGVQRPGRYKLEEEFQGLAGDSAAPGRTADPVGDLGLVPGYEAGNAADELPVTGYGPHRNAGRASHPGHVSVEGVPVIWVLSGECGHPYRFGVAHLIEQRVQVGIFDRP
jgi:hypothetical protein